MRKYTIEDLLIGQHYSPISSSRRYRGGVITHAEKRGNVWAGDEAEAYAITYSDPDNNAQWATVVVSLAD
jgi:hypothetical protein